MAIAPKQVVAARNSYGGTGFDQVRLAIAPKQVVAARNSYGGTGFDQVRLAIADAKHLMLTKK